MLPAAFYTRATDLSGNMPALSSTSDVRHKNGRPSQNVMDRSLKRCSIALMWKSLVLLLATVSLARAQENPTAYDALRVVGTKLNRDYVNRVISMTGVDGNPQPETWKILLNDPRARGGVREVEVANGNIRSERTPLRSVVGSAEGATINTAHLNLDSSGAYAVASHTADKSGTRFDRVAYTLRTDERGDPVWIVTLQGTSGRPVGTIHVNCNRGNVVRTEGMFAGTNMNDVETERDVEQQDDENQGPLRTARARLQETFRRAQDEARDMFDRVRRSFVDFINR
jgi:hypothetical protein